MMAVVVAAAAGGRWSRGLVAGGRQCSGVLVEWRGNRAGGSGAGGHQQLMMMAYE